MFVLANSTIEVRIDDVIDMLLPGFLIEVDLGEFHHERFGCWRQLSVPSVEDVMLHMMVSSVVLGERLQRSSSTCHPVNIIFIGVDHK